MDFIFKVDPIRRNIKVPDAFTVLTMDHNIHKLVFVCPYYEDFAFDSASIVFMIDAPDGRQYSIPAEEYESFPNSPSPYVKFTLTLKSYITSVVGYMSFCITADIISSGNVIEKSWHSKNISISVGGHIDNDDSEDIPEEDVPTINQRLNNLDSKVGRLQTAVNGMAGGVPPTASSTSGMNPEVSPIYVNTTDGNWYYYDGSVWQIGGVYGGAVTDTTLSISGSAADAKAVGDALALKADDTDVTALDTRVTAVEDAKQTVSFAYSGNLDWSIANGKCYLTVNDVTRIRFDTTNAAVDISKDAFIAVASASTLVTVSGDTISGTHYAVVFDFNTNTLKILDTALRTTYINTSILFYYHYGIIGGQLVYNKTALDTIQNTNDVTSLTSRVTAVEGSASGLKSDLDNATTVFRVDLKNQLVDGYIDVGSMDIGDTVNFAPHGGAYKTNKFACLKGDVFVVSGYLNANDARLWAFTDTEQILLSRCDNKVTLDNAYLIAPSDGYAIFSFFASSEYQIYKLAIPTDTGFAESGVPADSEAVGNALKKKQQIFFAYVASAAYDDIGWEIDGTTIHLTINNTIRVRFDTTNASVDTTKADFLSIAQNSNLVTVQNGVVSGTHFAIVFDFASNEIKILDTANRSTFINTAILFYWHYGALGGTLVNNKTALDTIQNTSDIADIQSQISTSLASYFVTEAETCRDSLISACDEKALVIAFTTDNHYSAPNGANFPTTVETIKKVNQLYPVDLVIDGGDLTNGDEVKANLTSRICTAVDMLCGIKGNAYTLLGNHDDGSFTSAEQPSLSNAELYSLFWRHGIIDLDNSGNTELYGYKDFDQYGIRLILLDSMHGSNGHAGEDWGYSDTELAWFTNTALDTQKQVVIFSHMPFTKEYSAYNYQVKNGTEMRQAVESFIANGGTCVGLFHGHTHWDFIGQYSQSNGFKEVSTGCGRVVPGPITNRTDYYPSGATMPERTADTVTQELWDIIVIKPESREVNLIRFGAGSDRSFTY